MNQNSEYFIELKAIPWGTLRILWQFAAFTDKPKLIRILLPDQSIKETFQILEKPCARTFPTDWLNHLIWPEKFSVNYRRAIELLRAIPVGKVISYQELGRAFSLVNASLSLQQIRKLPDNYRTKFIPLSRFIGQAMARNPFPILFPCHRVVRNNGSMGGFRGGIDLKEKLLQFEDISLISFPQRKNPSLKTQVAQAHFINGIELMENYLSII